MTSMFKATENKGFQITFGNGYTISCQFGANNYCNHYGRHLEPDYRYMEEMNKRIHSCENCEVAIWNQHDRWVTRDVMEMLGFEAYDDVQPNVTPDEVAKIIAYLVTL